MKPTTKHITFLDYFRGVAILAVLCIHSLFAAYGTDHLPWKGWFPDWHVGKSFLLLLPMTLGWLGVPIFFTVSGFCIHLSHQRSRQKGFKVFFLRRFFRIYPPYLLAFLFFALIFPSTYVFFDAGTHQPGVTFTKIEDFVSHFFLVHNFDSRFFFGTINGAMWSIAIEVQLYLLYPLLLGLTARWDWRGTLWFTAAIELGLRGIDSYHLFFNPSHHFPLFLTGLPFYFWFSWAMGAALADAFLKGAQLPFRNLPRWLWPLLLIICYAFRPFSVFSFTVVALASTCMMAHFLSRPTSGLATAGWKKHALEYLRWAGIVSYSTYLIHQPFLNLVPKMVSSIVHRPLPNMVMCGLCVLSWIPLFGLSYLIYRHVELPSIAWGKRVAARTQAPLPVS